ncbi:hypothetical protein NPIL_371181 [Nephila pilipes]|uniref:Uncharacterized protein n=1 Tax=Nephila pilipes TaxID=299642 RepID=A0A8X6T9U2_NEPPI|nr:hypothetical protein NPIL_371181 [Nephila pilipes]
MKTFVLLIYVTEYQIRKNLPSDAVARIQFMIMLQLVWISFQETADINFTVWATQEDSEGRSLYGQEVKAHVASNFCIISFNTDYVIDPLPS